MLEIVEGEVNSSRSAPGLMLVARLAVCSGSWSTRVGLAGQTRSLLSVAVVRTIEEKGRPGPCDLRPHGVGERLLFSPS